MKEVTYIFRQQSVLVEHLMWFQSKRWYDARFHPRYDDDYPIAHQQGKIKSADFALTLVLINAQIQCLFKNPTNENIKIYPEIDSFFPLKCDKENNYKTFNEIKKYNHISLNFKITEIKGFDNEISNEIIHIIEKSYLNVLMLKEMDVSYYLKCDVALEDYYAGKIPTIDWKASAEQYFPKEQIA